jgi:hypothetical protein
MIAAPIAVTGATLAPGALWCSFERRILIITPAMVLQQLPSVGEKCL